MKVAITGVSGYLGNLIVNVLADDPDVESILGLDVAAPRFRHAKLTFETADVLTADFASLLRGVDALFHLAFIVAPPRAMPLERIDRINVDGSRRVFEGAAAAGVGRFVYSSSVGAYGAHPDNPEVLREDSPLRPNPDWYYSRTKGAVERVLDELEAEHPGVLVVRLRPAIFLGLRTNNPLGTILKAPVLVCTRPDLRFGIVWDEDVARAFRMSLRHPKSAILNVTGGGAVTIHDIGRLMGKRVLVLNHRLAMMAVRIACLLGIVSRGFYEWLEVGSRGSIVISNDKAIRELNWKPTYDAPQAVARFAEVHHGRKAAAGGAR